MDLKVNNNLTLNCSLIFKAFIKHLNKFFKRKGCQCGCRVLRLEFQMSQLNLY